MDKKQIYKTLDEMKNRNFKHINALTDRVSVFEYESLAEEKNGIKIWTKAFQKAIDKHEFVFIPKRDEKYYIDNSLIIGSNRRIEAQEGAVICQSEGCRVLLMRNETTKDGTHMPIKDENKNFNISINGGTWEESYRERIGYGNSGMYDKNRSFYGVSTFMFFNNMKNLTLTNMKFAHTAGFSVQTGDIEDVYIENIEFESCYADGIHINGNTKNTVTKNIKGQVGDDLVALNMYDWQNSSVNFGPLDTVLCENLELYENSRYKAIRIQPGIYYYDD